MQMLMAIERSSLDVKPAKARRPRGKVEWEMLLHVFKTTSAWYFYVLASTVVQATPCKYGEDHHILSQRGMSVGKRILAITTSFGDKILLLKIRVSTQHCRTHHLHIVCSS